MPVDAAAPVLYVRIPASLKRELDAYRTERAATLTTSVTELLERGLASVRDESSVAELGTKVSGVEQELALTRIQLAEANAALAALRGREEEFRTLGERVDAYVGPCPYCRKDVRGTDVLLTQRCPHCARGLTKLLLGPPAQTKDLDRTELLLLLGVLGLVVGAAYLQSKSAN